MSLRNSLHDPLRHALENGVERLERTADEVANAVTHGIGLVLSVLGTILLIALAMRFGPAKLVAGCAIFGATLVLLYTASTCYHAACHVVRKHRLRTLDHLAILYLIAGTYTPLALGGLGGPWGWTMLIAIWALALTGTVYKLVAPVHFERGSLWLFLVMGWLCVLFGRPLVAALPTHTLTLLAAGGLSYTIGVVFFLRDRPRFDHALWHLFVIGGSACHYGAMVVLVLNHA